MSKMVWSIQCCGWVLMSSKGQEIIIMIKQTKEEVAELMQRYPDDWAEMYLQLRAQYEQLSNERDRWRTLAEQNYSDLKTGVH